LYIEKKYEDLQVTHKDWPDRYKQSYYYRKNNKDNCFIYLCRLLALKEAYGSRNKGQRKEKSEL